MPPIKYSQLEEAFKLQVDEFNKNREKNYGDGSEFKSAEAKTAYEEGRKNATL